jgi:hypothetical protein
VTFRRNHHRPHRNPSRPSALLSRPKLHSCKPFALYLLQSHAATNPFFCISYQKPGSGLPPISPVNLSVNSLVPIPTASLTPLLATLARCLTCVASKGLTKTLNPLLATLPKSRGRGSNSPYNARSSCFAVRETQSNHSRRFRISTFNVPSHVPTFALQTFRRDTRSLSRHYATRLPRPVGAAAVQYFCPNLMRPRRNL